MHLSLSPILLAFTLSATAVSGHGVLVVPISRAVRLAANTTDGLPIAGNCPGAACEWYTQQSTVPASQPTTNCDPALRTMGVDCSSPNDFPCTAGEAVPWCAPGYSPVKSPCGVFAGGLDRNTRDMLDLDSTPMATWTAGQPADVMYALTANHGGGFSYRLCPHSETPTEECFQAHHLDFFGSTQRIVGTDGKVLANVTATRTSTGTWPEGSQWTRNPIPQELDLGPKIPGLAAAAGRGPFQFGVMDRVMVPEDLPAGDYVLSWRWDAEQTKQVWSHCSDVTVNNPKSEAPLKPLPLNDVVVCDGASIGLEVSDCAAWVDLYDSLNGPNWPASWSQGCNSMRTDPCGCQNSWDKSIKCNDLRDYTHLSEIYLLGEHVQGTLPSSISRIKSLASLSIVETGLQGPLPASLSDISSLIYVWLDHNPQLTGEIPSAWSKMTQLYAFELHYNNLTGPLPKMSYSTIADCALQGNTFACPLPEGVLPCGASCK